jgi:hypothetical protein
MVKGCEHNKDKYYCVVCKGAGMCFHGVRKARCKDCGDGSEICNHNKIKHNCRECGENTYCIHDKRKYECRECKGGGVCIHDKIRSKCKKCDGTQICIHSKRKDNCIICSPQIACQLCKYITIRNSSNYKPYCFRCYCFLNPDAEISRKYKLKENKLVDEIKENYPNLNITYDKIVDNGCSKRRPDIRIELLTHTLIIECDEFQHKQTSCEEKRMMEIFQDLGERPIVFIRFNPDSYTNISGIKINSCFDKIYRLRKKEWEKRINVLNENINKYIKEIPKKLVTIEYLFYNEE